MESLNLVEAILITIATVILYQCISWAQNKWQFIWLNPLLFTIIIIIPCLLYNNIEYASYRQATQSLDFLLEPATVALGYPLYQQLKHVKQYWKQLLAILTLGVIIVITVSFVLTMLLIKQEAIAIALSLKSVTTPIGITLTEQLNGDSSITAFAIMIAGFSGAILGPPWLKLINVNSNIAIGMAIGTGSHVIGSIILSKSNIHQGAYSSVALITSALLTALIIPLLIPILSNLLS